MQICIRFPRKYFLSAIVRGCIVFVFLVPGNVPLSSGRNTKTEKFHCMSVLAMQH